MMRLQRCSKCHGEGYVGGEASRSAAYCPKCNGSGEMPAIEHDELRVCAHCHGEVRQLPEPAEVGYCDACQMVEPDMAYIPCNCGECIDSLEAADAAAARGLRLVTTRDV